METCKTALSGARSLWLLGGGGRSGPLHLSMASIRAMRSSASRSLQAVQTGRSSAAPLLQVFGALVVLLDRLADAVEAVNGLPHLLLDAAHSRRHAFGLLRARVLVNSSSLSRVHLLARHASVMFTCFECVGSAAPRRVAAVDVLALHVHVDAPMQAPITNSRNTSATLRPLRTVVAAAHQWPAALLEFADVLSEADLGEEVWLGFNLCTACHWSGGAGKAQDLPHRGLRTPRAADGSRGRARRGGCR